MYQCPKEGDIDLQDSQLSPGLAVHGCPSCGGSWIPSEHYADWQRQQNDPEEPIRVAVLPLSLSTSFQPAALDNRAALCLDCRSYLVRGRITLPQGSFYVERCPNCNGIWCDGGEWEILQQLELQTHIDYIFSADWQAQVRELEHTEREKLATIDKLGPDVAQRVFELADLLEQHPNGDFGVAYLMRRVDQ
ncbi:MULTISPECIES: zf-TFIIB domain-containing protein [Cyanophyceae]|uniref:Zf-TFIIB domain-containing protein n=1 Tax=Leptolyngbya subtilissima DQ-A4 TaxID=2933933 RepID=A0ABV0K9M6_9CYAN|nr:zf-TFIIB domain-containing protein [Nodosilinea sp. FACHB-141]MBD2110796.1 zf-TFIIB domain-containing protein [Nodosilinea sp. FACHB-141]